MNEAGGQGPFNRAEAIDARDHASVQIGNNDYSKTFYGGIHNHACREVTRDSVLADLASHSYRERKDINRDRVPNTCEWFLSHKRYRLWRRHPTSSMLRVSAYPGCGKSVLAKYLVDEELQSTKTTTTCYFFFKEGHGDQSNATTALRCILHQILSQRANLFSDRILRCFQQRPYLMASIVELWDVVVELSSEPGAGEVILILDAFDECSPEGQIGLERVICQFYGKESKNVNLKLLLTSRPHDKVVRAFRGMELSDLPVIHLAGEDEDQIKSISKEIDLVIAARVTELSLRLDLETHEAEYLRTRLSSFKNRTYLWVHLTMDVIANANRTTHADISSILKELPESVYDAYEKILNRSIDHIKARKLLEMMLVTTRPLQLCEVAVALDLEETYRTHRELEIFPEHKLGKYLQDLCGLFVMVINAEVFFLHQTAREFLMREKNPTSPGVSRNQTRIFITRKSGMDSKVWNWAHTISREEAHSTLGRLCVAYLLLNDFVDDFLDGPLEHSQQAGPNHVDALRSGQKGPVFPFLEYASRNWYLHCREAGFDSGPAISMMRLCGHRESGPTSKRWIVVNGEYGKDAWGAGSLSPLMIASRFGVTPVVRSILQTHPEAAKAIDPQTRRSALSFASEQGFIDILELLLKCKYSKRRSIIGPTRNYVDNRASDGRTPLSFAVLNGHTEIARLLLGSGAQTKQKDHFNGTPLSYALCSQDEDMVALFLNGGNAMRPRDLEDSLLTILCRAIVLHETRIVTRVIETNRMRATTTLGKEFLGEISTQLENFHPRLKINTTQSGSFLTETEPGTVAELAACAGSRAFFRAFETIGQPVNVRDRGSRGITLLHWAAVYNEADDGLIEELISKGASIDAMEERKGHTPLHWALWARNSSTAELLLSLGADPHKKTPGGNSAFKMGYWPHTAVAMLRANVCIPGLERIQGADRDKLKDFAFRQYSLAEDWPDVWQRAFHGSPQFDLSQLITAIAGSERGDDAVLRILVHGGVDLRFEDSHGRTLLHRDQASSTALLLLDHGAEPNIQDKEGQTPLHAAAGSGNFDKVYLLLSRGADPNVQDEKGETPLHTVTGQLLRFTIFSNYQERYLRVIKLLLGDEADPNIQDRRGQTALLNIIQFWRRLATVSQDLIPGGRDIQPENFGYLQDAVNLLIAYGADVNKQDSDGKAALHVAASSGSFSLVEKLLDAHADVGSSDGIGNTPLHYALTNGHRDIGDLLMDSGAFPGPLNNAGEPPMYEGIGFGKFRLRMKVNGPRGS